MRKASEIKPAAELRPKTGASKRAGDAELGRKLTALRKKHRLIQAQVSDETGIGRSNLAAFESGLFMPTLPALATLAAFYDVTLDELAGHLKPA